MMKTPSIDILHHAAAGKKQRTGVHGRLIKAAAIGMLAVIAVVVSGMVSPVVGSRSPVRRDIETTFHELLVDNKGDAAVQLLAQVADERGGWGPAPGDAVVFDATMRRLKRASTIAIDLPPVACAEVETNEPQNPDCGRDFRHQQHQLRFGILTFARPLSDGTFEPRPLDDMLSVYIEEAGHSWQEYCYETEGRCAGERTRPMTWHAGKRLVTGWEYQVKLYILSLDGVWLALSDAEREDLKSAICEGYANPRYRPVPAHGAPPLWPNPAGWPTTAPTADELRAFCGR